ncbi:MAG: hypothetical protein ACXAB9_12370 [Candidatus Thorarchaeota archaeon]|jgi:hypothetical protein
MTTSFPERLWDRKTNTGVHGGTPNPREWDHLVEEVLGIQKALIEHIHIQHGFHWRDEMLGGVSTSPNWTELQWEPNQSNGMGPIDANEDPHQIWLTGTRQKHTFFLFWNFSWDYVGANGPLTLEFDFLIDRNFVGPIAKGRVTAPDTQHTVNATAFGLFRLDLGQRLKMSMGVRSRMAGGTNNIRIHTGVFAALSLKAFALKE